MWIVILLVWIAVLALLPFVILVCLVTAGAFKSLKDNHLPGKPSGERTIPCFLFLIPAHNEEQVIKETIFSIKHARYAQEKIKILVIADNCSDNTSEIARMAGAKVLERKDEKKRGKGHALDDAIKKLKTDPENHFDALVIVDADTTIDPDLPEVFALHLQQGEDRLQAYYSVRNPDESWRTRLITYAFSLFNGVWLKGFNGLGLSASFRGNGMCFSREIVLRDGWQTYGLAEDLEFSWIIRIKGSKIFFVPEVLVFADMVARDKEAAKTQRQRWEIGRRSLKKLFLKNLLTSPALSLKEKTLYFLDLLMPPLTLIIVSSFGAFVLAGVNYFFLGNEETLSLLLFILSTIVSGGVTLYLLSPLVVMKTPCRYLLAGVYFPVYVFWKILVFLKKSPKEWVRTARRDINKKLK